VADTLHANQRKEGPAAPAPAPHTDAYMAMEEKRRLWRGFGRASAWFLLHLLMIVAYLTFVLAAGADWLGSLIVIAALGLIAGWLLRLGAAWNGFVAAFAVAVCVLRGAVALASGLLSG
jgi:hypothetical protein